MRRFRYRIPSPWNEILLFLLGCYFLFCAFYHLAPVTRDDAPLVQAVYERWDLTSAQKRQNQDIRLTFTQHAYGLVNDAFVTDELKSYLDRLQPGDILAFRMHPHSHTLLKLSHDGRLLLDFDEAVAQLKRDRIFTTVIGLFCCGTAAFLYAQNRKKKSTKKIAS